MEKRIGALLITVNSKENIVLLNEVLTELSPLIIARQGVHLKERALNVIPLVVEGTSSEINSLSGRIGKIDGIMVKSVLSKQN